MKLNFLFHNLKLALNRRAIKGLVERHPETRERMTKHAVEAAWQLSQWEAIEEAAAASAAPAKDWNLALANLLKCVHTEDRDGSISQSIALFTRIYVHSRRHYLFICSCLGLTQLSILW